MFSRPGRCRNGLQMQLVSGADVNHVYVVPLQELMVICITIHPISRLDAVQALRIDVRDGDQLSGRQLGVHLGMQAAERADPRRLQLVAP